MISNAAFVQLMQQINLPSVAAEYDRFALYCTQLQEWNQRMNLTAITDDEGVAEKHFADSLLPLTMVQLPVGASLVDVGSGAGFPGLPMALARPDLRVTFLDSLQKRLTFLAQLTQMLGVPAATLHARAEDAGQDKACREQFDLVLLDPPFHNGTLENILPLVDKCVAPGGIVICESETKLVLPAEVGGLQLKKQYKYGKVLLWKYVRPMADAAEEEGEA